MKVFKIILIVLMFLSLAVGMVLGFLPQLFVTKKYSNEVSERKKMKIKFIGYILMMLALALAMFQSLIEV